MHSGTSSIVYPVASQTVYRNTNGTGGETTSYSYTWGTNDMPAVITTDAPVISSGENGPGSADVTTRLPGFVWPRGVDGGRRRLFDLHGLRHGNRRRYQVH